MSILRIFYLVAAVVGTVVPLPFFIRHMNQSELSLWEAWNVNLATTGMLWDLIIAAVVLAVWILAEAIPRRDWLSLVAIPATFGIGVCCGLPLYLFLRGRDRG